MVRTFMFAASAALASAGCATTPPPADGGVGAARADAAFDRMAADGYAGSVLVACGPDVVYARDDGASAGPETSYWVASIAKQFTAALLIKLEAEGALSLYDTLAAHLDGVPADKAAITLDQLLTHRSGLPHGYLAHGIAGREDASASVLAADLAGPPGETFRYSDDNYVLAAIIAERAAGRPFETLLREEVFAPAGLRDVYLWPDETTGHAAAPSMVAAFDADARRAHWGFKGPNGVRLSVVELHRWYLALRGGEVLGHAGAARLFGPHALIRPGLETGYGWFWSVEDDGTETLWTRGSEEAGGNAVLYTYPGTGWIVAAATHAGPPETGDGPVTGWSRRARDVLADAFVAGGAEACPA